jgi:hypothetical protein
MESLGFLFIFGKGGYIHMRAVLIIGCVIWVVLVMFGLAKSAGIQDEMRGYK